jgi:hypothetical protein
LLIKSLRKTFVEIGDSLFVSFKKFSAICTLGDGNNSTAIQNILCQIGSKNVHRRRQAEEVKETVADWLNGLDTDFYNEGIVKLVQCLHNA